MNKEPVIYNSDMRFTEGEVRLLKDTFEQNESLLKLMRKVFLPEFDPNAPIGQAVDVWSIKDISAMSPEECKIYFLARRDLIQHVETQILQLKILASMKIESPMEKAAKDAMNSSK